VCTAIGTLLSALIKKCVYTDKGTKLDKKMYQDLFKEMPSPSDGTIIDKMSPSGITIRNIYSDQEYQYHDIAGTSTFKLFNIKRNDIEDGLFSELQSLSSGNNMPISMNKIAEFLNKRALSKTDRLVAFFFDIALVIYSLYYKKNDTTPEDIDTSLGKVYRTIVKSFMLPSINTIVGNTDTEILQTFIKYYKSSINKSDFGAKQTARLNLLRKKSGGRRITRKRKRNSKKYTRRK
jgi:hypothetical protein